MSVILYGVVNPTFIQGLVTAVSSACVSGMFLLVSTYINNKRTDEKVDDVKRHIASVDHKVDEIPSKDEGSNG